MSEEPRKIKREKKFQKKIHKDKNKKKTLALQENKKITKKNSKFTFLPHQFVLRLQGQIHLKNSQSYLFLFLKISKS